MAPRDILSKIMKGWHASPHDFDEFRHDPGVARTGAGNAAYGEGIYAARDYDEMDEYYKWFKGKNNDADELYDIVYDIQKDNPRGYGTPADQAFVMERLRGSKNPNLRALADNPDAMPALMTIVDDQGSPKNAYAVSQATQRLKNHLQAAEPKVHRYELEIGAPENQFLDWTERLTDQSDDVRTIMSDLLKPDLERMQEGRNAILKKGGTGSPGSRWFKPLSPETQAEYASGSPNPTGENMYRILQKRKNPMEDTPESAQYASDTLRDAGIPGNLHPDAQNNPRRNVAIFDPKILKIIKQFGIPGAISMGVISQADGDAYAASMPQATKNGTRLFGKESLWETPSHRSGPSRDELRDMLSEAAQPPSTARQTAPSDALLKKAQTYNAGFTGEKKYDPGDYDAGKGEMFWDALQSAGTAARNVTESTIGTIGDWTKSSHELAQSIADYGKSKGSSIDQTGSVAAMSKSPLTQSTMPTSEDVHGAAESVLDKTVSPDWRKFITDWSEHEATTPWGSASGATVDTLFDPVNALGAPGKVAKVAKKAARFFR